MVIRKKQLLAVTLIIALGAAVFVNWYYNRPGSKAVSAPQVSAEAKESGERELGEARYVISADVTQVDGPDSEVFFPAAKEKRSQAHSEAAEKLNSVIKDSAASSSAVKEAVEKLGSLADNIEKEAELENLLKAKLGCEVLAVIGDGTVKIVVGKNGVDASSAVQIQETVSSATGINGEKVSIIEYNS